MFFGHGPELIIILVIALIVLGPGKLPEVAGMLGKAIRELRNASADLQKTFNVNELMNEPAPPPLEDKPVEQPPAAEAVTVSGSAAEVLPADAQPPGKPKRTRKKIVSDGGATASDRANPLAVAAMAAAESGPAESPVPVKRRRRATAGARAQGTADAAPTNVAETEARTE